MLRPVHAGTPSPPHLLPSLLFNQTVGCRYSARARDHMGSSEAFARRVLAPCYTHHKDVVIPPLLSDPQRRCHFFVAVELFFQLDFKFQSPNKALYPTALGRAVHIYSFPSLAATLLFFLRIASPATETASSCSGRTCARIPLP